MTNFRKGNPSESEELYWTAFCYVAGEMTPVQQDQFELRLEYDQTAREAVEGVVSEMQSLRLALEPQSEPSQRLHTSERRDISSSSTVRRLSGLRLTATATLAIVLIGVSVFFFEPLSRTAPLAYLSPEVYLSPEKKSTTISRDLDPSESEPVAKESDLFEESDLFGESDLFEWNEASWIMAIEDWNFYPRNDELDQGLCYDESLADIDEQDCFAADATEGFEWILEAFQAATEDDNLEHTPLGCRSPNLKHFG